MGARGGRLTSGATTFPDFLCIGAQKAGTSWLDAQLRAHPSLWLPPEKELHYFDPLVDKSLDLRAKLFGRQREAGHWRFRFKRRIGADLRALALKNVAWDLRYYFGRPSDAWYASLFAQGRGKVKGEVTPGYAALEPETVAHIHALMPDARIIFLVRNPIERAWSRAVEGSSGRGFALNFRPGEEGWTRHFEGEGPRARSDYLRTLEVWGAHYPESRIFVGFFEDLHFCPEKLIARIHEFLGVEPLEVRLDLGRRVHGGAEQTIPLAMAIRLAELYREAIGRLSERFGGHAAWWEYVAERLLEESPESDARIPYPFYDASYRQDWLSVNGYGATWTPPLQSGALPSRGASKPMGVVP